MTSMLSLQQMRDKIKEERRNEQHEESDAFFMVVMSHGCGDDYIYSTDEQSIHVRREIIDRFDHRNCPALEGKPKVFIIQACLNKGMESITLTILCNLHTNILASRSCVIAALVLHCSSLLCLFCWRTCIFGYIYGVPTSVTKIHRQLSVWCLHVNRSNTQVVTYLVFPL